MRISRTQRVLDYLKQNGSITPMQALRFCGSYRLSAVIMELRKAHNIVTELGEIRDDGTRECCTYYYKGAKTNE